MHWPGRQPSTLAYARSIPLTRPFIEFSEANGKIVQSLRVYDDPPSGREIHLKFSDGTAISIEIGIQSVVSGKHYRENQGDVEVLLEHRDAPLN
jgi:hypothetical protein